MIRPCPMAVLALLAATAAHGQSFVNWETPHVSPIDLTPDGSRLLAVNTADNRLEVFTVTGEGIAAFGSVPVGLDPVSVRARTDAEAWVVNHVSDTVSVVDLGSMRVIATLHTGDEPADVVFAGSPERAFITVSQLNQVKVYDPADLALAPVVLEIEGEDPRALATDGTSVYAAIFESGNGTTILQKAAVSSGASPYAGSPNPPPNAGAGFDPPIAGDLPTPPEVGHVVRKDGLGAWLDDNGGDWSAAVTWDLHDHDVAIIDARSLAVSYATGLMNANMALGPHPDGGVTVVGTEALNEVRFEPVLKGVFLLVMGAHVTGSGAGSATDLNPHLDYSTPTVAQEIRDQSLGDPRGVAWRDASRGFITGMGSNNVAVVDGALARTALVEVGEGPTGAVYDASHDRVYVLNKFEGSISVIDADTLAESRLSFYDPTPADVRNGRPFLYDTHRTSGLGHTSCASCHIDARMDQLAWDLGDPSGAVKPFNQDCDTPGVPCEDWHPMKGPLVTQTFIGIIGTEPLHWRGDREDLAAFNGAFESLLGDDTQLTDTEMTQFETFVAALVPPPNPYRELDNALPATLFNGGAPATGEVMFGLCANCHAPPTGTTGGILGGELNGSSVVNGTQPIKISQLRNVYEKTGFDRTSSGSNRGFGFLHDGNTDTLMTFLGSFPFDDQQRRDLEAFLLCFSTETIAGVGAQAMLPQPAAAGEPATASELIALAAGGEVGLVVKAVIDGEPRGYYRAASGDFQSDRAAEVVGEQDLLALAMPGQGLLFTVVPAGSEVRIGVDRDEDGHLDGDELDAGTDPADPNSPPLGDLDGDGLVGITDLLMLLASWGPCADPCPPACLADLDGDCAVEIGDFLVLVGNWS